MDLKPLLAELAERVGEELDYEKEAASQRAFAKAFRGDPDIVVPDVLGAGHTVIISEWLEGTPLSRIIADGTQEERDAAGLHYIRFLLSVTRRASGCCTPTRTRATSGSPPTGASASWTSAPWRTCPTASRRWSATCMRIAMKGDADAVLAGLREEGFVKTDHHARGAAACSTSSTRSSIRPGPRRSSSAASGCAGSSPGSTTRATRTSRSA